MSNKVLNKVFLCIMCSLAIRATLKNEYGQALGKESENETPEVVNDNLSKNEVPKDDLTNQEQITVPIKEEYQEDELTEQEYFSSPSKNFKCLDHVKMLEMAYSCMDSESMTPEDMGMFVPDDIEGATIQTIFVVSKNGKKSFMKILDKYYNLELKLVPTFADDYYALWLLEYKIVKGRYVGIYSYLPHYNTVKHHIMSKTLTLFQKVYILRRIALIASDFYSFVNPQNNLIQLNIWPSNILLTQEGFLSTRLINYVVTEEQSDVFSDFPEYLNKNSTVNQKTTTVYLIGKLIFFYLYGRHSTIPKMTDEPEIIELNKSENTDRETRVMKYLVQVTRGMVEENPIDRPSIELVLSQFENALDVLFNPWTTLDYLYSEYLFTISHEIKVELENHEDQVRIAARSKSLNKLKTKRSTVAKDEVYIEQVKALRAKNEEFFDYEGMVADCKIEPTHQITNYLESYGFIPALISMYEDNDVVAEDVLQEKTNGTRGATNEDTSNMDPRQMRFEFFILIGILSILVLMVIAYFFLKNLKVIVYEKEFFSAHLDIF